MKVPSALWLIMVVWPLCSVSVGLYGQRVISRSTSVSLPINWPGSRPRLPRNAALAAYFAIAVAMSALGVFVAYTGVMDRLPVIVALGALLPVLVPFFQVVATRIAVSEEAERLDDLNDPRRLDPRKL